MFPGNEVRLKGAYIVRCDDCVKDAEGNVTEVRCTVDLDSFSGSAGADRKIKGKTLHWVSCHNAVKAEVRLYDRLWKVENPRDELERLQKEEGLSYNDARQQMLNPDNLRVLTDCYVEPYAATMKPLSYLQFQRIGYFNVDPDSTADHLVFNKTVGLKDTWKK
jgi:glutaminyl-tRNA synthetase